MKEIIVSGCSYSTNTGVTPYGSILENLSSVKVSNTAWPGQSNKSIIRQFRDEIKKGITDTIFICQLTHLHRLNLYCTLNNKYIDFQPNFIKIIPELKDGNVVFDVDTESPHKGTFRGISAYGVQKETDFELDESIYKEFFSFYRQYLKYFYDDVESFYNLMDDIDDLNGLVKSSGNKILFLYWPHITPDIGELKKRNILNIDGEYSLLNWSTKNNLLDGRTSHLSQEGHRKLSKKIITELNLGKNKNIFI